jgi:histidyl-tRNA synthetase
MIVCMKIQSVRGMNDIAGEDSFLWRYIESKARKIFETFGYQEIRTPLLENTALFARGVGEGTDIVEKEMYTFLDRNGDSLTLRPEGTASVVRASIEHNWFRDNPVQKFYYIGPMFRHERPQKGRYRQFFQLGAEQFGVEGFLGDVEVIQMQHQLLTSIGIENVELHLSSLGCDVCRPPYRDALIQKLESLKDELPVEHHDKIHKNPLRIFDSKDEACMKITAKLPKMVNSLCADCNAHFDGVRDALVAVKVPFKVNSNIVRGIDYYNRTVFEFIANDKAMGSQATVSAGGRYDGLVATLGGPQTPAVGFAAGIERLAMLLEDLKPKLQPVVDLYCVIPDKTGLNISLQIADALRKLHVRVEVDLQMKAMKNQLKRANKLNAKYALIIGEQEISHNFAILKNMQDQTQEEILLTRLEEDLLKRFKTSSNYRF